ncbi:DUF6146 family protein [Flavobacterium sp.]|uniref:DUF6146 family protein n=1 Tax=Flavobacterium sp. TaxID=239 RepID=UPI0028BEB277|nr:DUF6146 family protein [Flavobacterium sp.]
MKNLICTFFIVAISVFFGCNSASKPVSDNSVQGKSGDTIRIANDSLEYEIIIIDGRFNSWLYSNARPRGFYSQSFLEGRNIPWVIEWNQRVVSPRNQRESNLFMMSIDYQNGVNYGYEVNYMLYNYLVYFQTENNIRLGGFAPRP